MVNLQKLLLCHITCMQCIDAAYCYRCSMVCVPVGHNHQLCRNCSINQDAVCGVVNCVDWGGIEKPCTRWGAWIPNPPKGKGNYGWHVPAHCEIQGIIIVMIQLAARVAAATWPVPGQTVYCYFWAYLSFYFFLFLHFFSCRFRAVD